MFATGRGTSTAQCPRSATARSGRIASQVTVLLTAKKTRTAHQESTATTLRGAWVTVFQVVGELNPAGIVDSAPTISVLRQTAVQIQTVRPQKSAQLVHVSQLAAPVLENVNLVNTATMDPVKLVVLKTAVALDVPPASTTSVVTLNAAQTQTVRTQKSALLDHVNLETQKAARMTTSVDYSSTATVGPAHQAAQMTVLVKDAFLV